MVVVDWLVLRCGCWRTRGRVRGRPCVEVGLGTCWARDTEYSQIISDAWSVCAVGDSQFPALECLGAFSELLESWSRCRYRFVKKRVKWLELHISIASTLTVAISPENGYPTNPRLPTFLGVHRTGRILRYIEHDFVPPSTDPRTGVVSRDVAISPENNVAARIFLPKTTRADPKLPLLIYIHGDAFSLESAFSSAYHSYATSLASKSRSVVVSFEYRLARSIVCRPPHIPVSGKGPTRGLTSTSIFNGFTWRATVSAPNIAHNMVVRAKNKPDSMADDVFSFEFADLILIHPFFGSDEPDELWEFICPDSAGVNDVWLNPAVHLDLLSKLGSERVLVCVAEKDLLRDRGWNYYQGLKRSE
ncbi:2-hydroxyisoflavanone dehydratase [Sesamum alatum]|uniref:2-hydroxyisoflavanone dehydratase n=1 Tax=Sesamum alatum TaxID=300844 RepID=A0AAE1YX19_9LAMI|nr:2-hydroxyisoflavanone dehydratase [Sesamum alatum]